MEQTLFLLFPTAANLVKITMCQLTAANKVKMTMCQVYVTAANLVTKQV